MWAHWGTQCDRKKWVPVLKVCVAVSAVSAGLHEGEAMFVVVSHRHTVDVSEKLWRLTFIASSVIWICHVVVVIRGQTDSQELTGQRGSELFMVPVTTHTSKAGRRVITKCPSDCYWAWTNGELIYTSVCWKYMYMYMWVQLSISM